MTPRHCLAPILLLFLAGCNPAPSAGGGAPPPGARRLPRVLVVPVETRTLAWTLSAMGEVEPREQVQVSSPVAGIVSGLAFVEGDAVTTATVLCTVDEERYQLEEARARAELDRARAEQVRAREIHGQRVQLFKEKVISSEELAEARAASDRADAEVARADVQLKIAAKALRDCRVRPPIAGRIESKRVSTGEYLAAGGAVATIVDVSELRVRFVVPETESSRVTTGLKAVFRPRGSGAPEDASVYWVSQVADAGTRSVECRARLARAPETVRPGSSGTVTLSMEAKEPSVVVPAEAVFPTERGFVTFVVVEGKARRRTLKVGVRTEDDRIEVVEGLAAGETLVLRGGSVLKDGQEVEIAK